MVDIDGILAAAIRTVWLQVDGPESLSLCRIEVETARRVRIALEREGIMMTPSRPTPEVGQFFGGSIPIEELKALSHCQIEHVTNLLARQAHAAATTSRHVCMADARKARCVLAEVRWRWTLKVL